MRSRGGSPEVRAEFESGLGFPLDRFQAEACDAIDAGRSVLVAAPTSAGKTVVAEYGVAVALARGRKAFYTTPIKALSNQKFHDLGRIHGHHRVGLLTGDNAINADAPVVVMTTEVLRNMIYERSPVLLDLGVVVLDEVHYLQDPYRGAVWEEVIIHLSRDVRLVCLSATVSNAEEVGEWLTRVRGDTAVIIEEERPVRLEHRYVVATRGRDDLMMFPTFVDHQGRNVPNPRPSRYDPTGRRGGPPTRRREPGPAPVAPRRSDVVRLLDERDLLPAIYFVFSRAGCDEAVRQCLDAGRSFNDADEQAAVIAVAERHAAVLGPGDRAVLGFDRWLRGLEAGIAPHHAGMVPPMKEAVEEAFLAGLVKVVFATETLALGINMPARSVVIERLSKFTGERHEMLSAGQYTQLTGRAGRRGIDDHGEAVVLWNRFTTFEQVASLASRRTYELTSSFRPTYNMAVNLVRRYDHDQARHLLNLSFAQFRVDREVVSHERQREDLERALAEAGATARCDRGDIDEYFALHASVESAARREEGSGAREAALASLHPGDIVHAGGRVGRVVVLSRSGGRGASTRVTALSERGKTIRLGPSSFRQPPRAIGRIKLPEPYRPKSPTFRREATQRLRNAATRDARHARHSAGVGELAALRRQLREHPVHSCPDLAAHLEARERARRVRRRLERGQRTSQHRSATLADHFERVLQLLGERGYVDDWTLTPAGEVLSRIYGETDLLVAESLRLGLLDGLDPAETAAVASVFTYEERGPEGAAPRPHYPTSRTAQRVHAIEDLWQDLVAAEQRLRLPETRRPDPGFVDAVHHWATGGDLETALGDEELTGGDFVRNVKQVLDLLTQISDATKDHSLAMQARTAAHAVFRGVVEASARVT